MSLPMGSLADLSNILAVFLVLSCLFTMVTYIIRLQHVPSSVVHVARHATPQPMLRVRNPFTCQLCDPRNSSLAGIKFNITTEVPCILQAYWGVLVNNIHHMLNVPWETLRDILQEGSLLESSCLARNKQQQLDCVADHIIDVVPDRALSTSELGHLPRIRYPLAILMVQINNQDDDNQCAVVGMLTLVHIKDSVCTMETSILAQYLKQANGAVYCLKPLYIVSSSNTEEAATTESHSDAISSLDIQREENELCVVCQIRPVTRALLPCRHTCVCAPCFRHLDKCPLCRGLISSYFCIREEIALAESPTPEAEEASSCPRTWTDYWDHINQRLNEYFGIA